MAVSRTRKKKKNRSNKPPQQSASTPRDTMVPALPGIQPSGPAAEQASEDDRAWFDLHPGESVRVRQAFPGEHEEHLSANGWAPLAPTQKLATVVVQAKPGRRLRIPFKVVTTELADQDLTTGQLDAVRAEWEAGDQTMPVKNSRGETVDMVKLFRMAMSGEPPTAANLKACLLRS
ncbi:hypothetical protein [Streptomyces cacaoi]|uniref:hypothetical protein n=1 Tax=Streptomyces cacaoi TaxID=1898 RepID=UPI002630C508|nr:hypothetical protein [Streptomyces cacaoi]